MIGGQAHLLEAFRWSALEDADLTATEVPLQPDGSEEPQKSVDMVAVFEEEREAWIVEAKTDWTASTVQKGLGQLLVYERLAEEGRLAPRRGGVRVGSSEFGDEVSRAKAANALLEEAYANRKAMVVGVPAPELEDRWPKPGWVLPLFEEHDIRVFAEARSGASEFVNLH